MLALKKSASPAVTARSPIGELMVAAGGSGIVELVLEIDELSDEQAARKVRNKQSFRIMVRAVLNGLHPQRTSKTKGKVGSFENLSEIDPTFKRSGFGT